MKRFTENKDGVHLMSGINTEYSICGDAFDIGSEPGEEDLVETNKRIVTCPMCIREITNCNNVYWK